MPAWPDARCAVEPFSRSRGNGAGGVGSVSGMFNDYTVLNGVQEALCCAEIMQATG
jgi:hypothetical protein